jgi:16S rRNA (guanine1516-N2)-methyltransferase
MTTPALWILCQSPELEAYAVTFAEVLQLPLKSGIDPAELQEPEFVLTLNEAGLALQQTGRKAPGPIMAEFTEGSVDHRRKFGGGKGQMIAKAVGLKAGVYPFVLDATAGLGKDAFVLATLGCRVRMLERSPVVHALLQDGLMRARRFATDNDPGLAQLLANMALIASDSQDYLVTVAEDDRPDVIYLDPMFPDRSKTADVKKEMRAFHLLVGKDEDADALLDKALAAARYRVVDKRPRKSPFIAERAPSYQLEGKSSRYDIYTIKKLPDHLN